MLLPFLMRALTNACAFVSTTVIILLLRDWRGQKQQMQRLFSALRVRDLNHILGEIKMVPGCAVGMSLICGVVACRAWASRCGSWG